MERTGDGAGARMERAAARIVAERVGARRLLARLDAIEGTSDLPRPQSGTRRQEPEGTIMFDKARRRVHPSVA
jgi:hypothetical protein